MFDNKSIYALNKKDPDAIIYKDAMGKIIRLTRDDFESEDEFSKFKKLSDENYRIEENNDQKHNRKTISLSVISEQATATPSIEEDIEEDQKKMREAEIKKLLKSSILKDLTKAQRRRLLMYYVDKMSEEDIAAKENISQQAVSKSLQAAKKFLKKFCENRL